MRWPILPVLQPAHCAPDHKAHSELLFERRDIVTKHFFRPTKQFPARGANVLKRVSGITCRQRRAERRASQASDKGQTDVQPRHIQGLGTPRRD
jgi:hypothetical protein